MFSFRCFWLIPAFLVMWMAGAPAMAQSGDDVVRRDTTDPGDSAMPAYSMEPLEVTVTPFRMAGGDAPFAVSTRTLSDDELNTRPALTLDDVTTGLPGLSVASREHYATGDRVTIRGLGWRAQFGVRGVQVLLDGVPLTVADGQAMMDVVDPAFVRSMEVIRGPASTFWGNASGGVLALSTRPAGGADHTVCIRQVAGSYGRYKTDAQVTVDRGAYDLSAYTSYLAQDGYRAQSQTQLSRTGFTSNVDLGESRGLRLMGALAYMPKAQNPSTLDAEALRNDRRQAREAAFRFDTGKESTQGQLGATYYDQTAAGTLNATFYAIRRVVDNPIPFGYIDLGRNAGGGRVTLEGTTGDLQIDWGVGVEAKLQRDDRKEFGNDGGEPSGIDVSQKESVNTGGVFGRAALPIGRVRLRAGLRYDRMQFEANDFLNDNDGTRTFSALSPSVGIAVDAGTARFFSNFSTGLEAPTANELSNRPDGLTGFNPDVGPETIYSLETGVQGVVPRARLSYDLTLYGMRVDDLLVPYQLPDESNYYRNAGSTRHGGVETALRWQMTDAVALQGSYTYLLAEFLNGQTADGTSLDGNRIPGVSPHQYGIEVDLRTDVVWAAVELEGRGSYSVNSLNTATNDAFARVNLRVSHPGLALTSGARVAPFAAVYNAFDTAYSDVVVNAFGGRYYEPAAGRNFAFGVTLQVE